MAERKPRRQKKTESDVEPIKRDSKNLRGTIAETLESDATHFSEADYQLLKFHGIYQQYDRDTALERQKAKEDPDYSFMVRVAIPGGRVNAEQYAKLDELADECANGTLRITTRQGIQYHGVPKGDLESLMAGINGKLLTTLAACGDVERNVMASPAPLADEAHQLVQQLARDIAKDLAPKASAYHEIWLNGEKVTSTQAEEEPDPFYGKQYLPRKFKTGIALATDNSIDVYSYDAGLVAVVENGRVVGLQVTAGGGFGMTHNKENTIATLAKPIAFVQPEHGVAAVRTIAAIFRDEGNRINRKQARLKYLIRDWGIDKFREEFARRADFPHEPPRELPRPEFHDYLGQHPQGDGRFFYGVFVENGRIGDFPDGRQVRTGLREAVRQTGCNVIFTPNQNLLLTDLDETQVATVERVLRDHKVPLVEQLSNTRRYAMACPALPTCGLALTESERIMPSVVDQFADAFEDLGLEDERITLRMTGCPNGCARPYTADIGFVGRKPGQRYNVYVGGSLHGDRIADLWAEDVHVDELVDNLRPLLKSFAQARQPDESFSDFYMRISGKTTPRDTVSGKEDAVQGTFSLPVVS